MILQTLLDHRILHQDDIAPLIGKEPKRVARIARELIDEGFISENREGMLCLSVSTNTAR